jgi:hypothetical protein
MRRMLAGITLIALTAITGAASPVLAPPAPQCSSIGTGLTTDITIPFAVWTAPNFFCEQTDKILSNFAVTGAIAPNTTLEIQEQQLGAADFHVITFNGNFVNLFGVSYDIAVDLTRSPLARIVRVSGDLSNPSDVGNPANVKTVFLESGAMVGQLTSTANLPGTPIVTNATALHVVDSYAPLGGAAVSISNTFAEQDTPELASVILIGSGLMLISRMRSKRAHIQTQSTRTQLT